MRSVTSTTLPALGLCPHSSKIKQVVLTWVLPDLMSTNASSGARSFCGRRPQEAPIGNSEVRRRKEGSEYTVCFQISRHCGQLRLSPLGTLRDGVERASELSPPRRKEVRPLVHQRPVHHWSSSTSEAMIRLHFWLSLCARPSAVHQSEKKKSPRQSHRSWQLAAIRMRGEGWRNLAGRQHSLLSRRRKAKIKVSTGF